MSYRFFLNPNRTFSYAVWDGAGWVPQGVCRLEDIPVVHSAAYNWALKH